MESHRFYAFFSPVGQHHSWAVERNGKREQAKRDGTVAGVHILLRYMDDFIRFYDFHSLRV